MALPWLLIQFGAGGAATYSLAGRCLDLQTQSIPIPSATVHLFLTADDTEQGQTTSDIGGNYSFTGLSTTGPYYVVAYLAGSPDIFGTTVNTLTAS